MLHIDRGLQKRSPCSLKARRDLAVPSCIRMSYRYVHDKPNLEEISLLASFGAEWVTDRCVTTPKSSVYNRRRPRSYCGILQPYIFTLLLVIDQAKNQQYMASPPSTPKRKRSILPTSFDALLHPGWRTKRARSGSRPGSPTNSGASTPGVGGSESYSTPPIFYASRYHVPRREYWTTSCLRTPYTRQYDTSTGYYRPEQFSGADWTYLNSEQERSGLDWARTGAMSAVYHHARLSSTPLGCRRVQVLPRCFQRSGAASQGL